MNAAPIPRHVCRALVLAHMLPEPSRTVMQVEPAHSDFVLGCFRCRRISSAHRLSFSEFRPIRTHSCWHCSGEDAADYGILWENPSSSSEMNSFTIKLNSVRAFMRLNFSLSKHGRSQRNHAKHRFLLAILCTCRCGQNFTPVPSRDPLEHSSADSEFSD